MSLKVIVALDFVDYAETINFVKKLDPSRFAIKIGSTLFTLFGPPLIETLAAKGFSIFLDLKFHDIPHQVQGACRAAASLGVWMLSLHLSGGRKMCEAAVEAVSNFSAPPILIGVTVLTSFSQEEVDELHIMPQGIEAVVQHYAGLAQQYGLHGIVCSPKELSLLEATKKEDFLYVTPGIRRAGSAFGDQVRVTTPEAAYQAGASYLVVGRDITQSEDPEYALSLYT